MVIEYAWLRAWYDSTGRSEKIMRWFVTASLFLGLQFSPNTGTSMVTIAHFHTAGGYPCHLIRYPKIYLLGQSRDGLFVFGD